MPVIINEFEVEIRDEGEERETPSSAGREPQVAPLSPLLIGDMEQWRRAREERLSDD